MLVLHGGYGNLSRIKQYPPLKAFRAEDEPSPRLRKVCSYATHIIFRAQTVPIIVKILELCPNVGNLAIWSPRGQTWRLIDTLSHRPISRLSMDLGLFCVSPSISSDAKPEHASPLTESIGLRIFDALHYLTHLTILTDGAFGVSKCHYLTRLPRLTHVAIRTYEPRDVVQPILSACPNLTMLIVFSDDLVSCGEDLSWMTDRRLVILDSPPDALTEWWNSAKGKKNFKDFWMLGEEEIFEATNE